MEEEDAIVQVGGRCDVAVACRPRGRAGGRRATASSGSFLGFFVGDISARDPIELGHVDAPAKPDGDRIIGLCTVSWSVADPAPLEQSAIEGMTVATSGRHSSPIWGYLRYVLLDAWLFQEWQQVPDTDCDRTDPTLAALWAQQLDEATVIRDDSSLQTKLCDVDRLASAESLLKVAKSLSGQTVQATCHFHVSRCACENVCILAVKT